MFFAEVHLTDANRMEKEAISDLQDFCLF